MGVVLTTTGIINPKSKEPIDVAEAPQAEITTPVVQESKPEPEPVKEPEPEPVPEPAKEPEPVQEPVKEPEPQQEEPKEKVNTEQAQEQEAKPEEEEITPVVEKSAEANEDKGISVLNIILYIMGAIAVIAAGIYFFMRREPTQSAADIARKQTSSEPTPEPQEETAQEEPAQEETAQEEPAKEETQTETTETEENSNSENTNDQSSNNDDENNNK